MMRFAIATLVVAAGVSSASALFACESDKDCKGDRVCEAGKCVLPDPAQEEAPRKAKTSSPKVRGEPHPWAIDGERLEGWVVTTRLAGVFGQTLREDRRQYYGLGAAFGAGLTSTGGAYIGAQYSPHFGGTVHVDEYLGVGERLTGEMKYDSYNAGVEFGVDQLTAASSPIVFRATAGIGWSTYYAKGFLNPTSMTPLTQIENVETYLYLDARALFAWKVGDSWHLDADVRWLIVPAVEEGMFTNGTIAYGLGFGRRL